MKRAILAAAMALSAVVAPAWPTAANRAVLETRYLRFLPATQNACTMHTATDELGLYGVESPHDITAIHAMVLYQLSLDSRKLEVPGRKRLDIDHCTPMKEILA